MLTFQIKIKPIIIFTFCYHHVELVVVVMAPCGSPLSIA